MEDYLKLEVSEVEASLEHVMHSDYDDFWNTDRNFPNDFNIYIDILKKMVNFILQNRNACDMFIPIKLVRRIADSRFFIYAYADGTEIYFDVRNSVPNPYNPVEFTVV